MRRPDADHYDWWANTTLPRIKAVRAVVKAARNYCDGINGVPGSAAPEDAWILLDEAIEELKAAEKGE